MPDKENPSGSFAAPPAGAPYEVARDLSPELLADQRAKAAANERSLRPLTFDQPGESLAPKPKTESAAEKNLAETIRLAHANRQANPMPAASESDSPARGVPRPIDDPGKQITGGFGIATEAQYFPLDGAELGQLVQSLLTKLSKRIENDLRFHLAITYPRVHASVTIAVDGYAREASFTVAEHVFHEKTTIESALAHDAVPTEFKILEERREFDEQEQPQDPPDRIRDELGLEKPHKQTVGTGTGRMIVDRVSDLGDSF